VPEEDRQGEGVGPPPPRPPEVDVTVWVPPPWWRGDTDGGALAVEKGGVGAEDAVEA